MPEYLTILKELRRSCVLTDQERDALSRAIADLEAYKLITSSMQNSVELLSIKGWIINFHSPEDGWCAYRASDGKYVGDPQRFYPLPELLKQIDAFRATQEGQ